MTLYVRDAKKVIGSKNNSMIVGINFMLLLHVVSEKNLPMSMQKPSCGATEEKLYKIYLQLYYYEKDTVDTKTHTTCVRNFMTVRFVVSKNMTEKT
jgi:uncharacterized membrane protein